MDIMAVTVWLQCIFGDVIKSVWSQSESSGKKMSKRWSHSLTSCPSQHQESITFLVASWLTWPPGSCCSEQHQAAQDQLNDVWMDVFSISKGLKSCQNNLSLLTIVSSEVQVVKMLLIYGIYLLSWAESVIGCSFIQITNSLQITHWSKICQLLNSWEKQWKWRKTSWA